MALYDGSDIHGVEALEALGVRVGAAEGHRVSVENGDVGLKTKRCAHCDILRKDLWTTGERMVHCPPALR